MSWERIKNEERVKLELIKMKIDMELNHGKEIQSETGGGLGFNSSQVRNDAPVLDESEQGQDSLDGGGT